MTLPDAKKSGKGLSAGGSLSPLIGAIYLTPLDNAMTALGRKHGLFYVRYMDDFVIMAKTRWHFRKAIAEMHRVLERLCLRVHATKRFIGHTTPGFDFMAIVFIQAGSFGHP